jgi:hypothetical protein
MQIKDNFIYIGKHWLIILREPEMLTLKKKLNSKNVKKLKCWLQKKEQKTEKII